MCWVVSNLNAFSYSYYSDANYWVNISVCWSLYARNLHLLHFYSFWKAHVFIYCLSVILFVSRMWILKSGASLRCHLVSFSSYMYCISHNILTKYLQACVEFNRGRYSDSLELYKVRSIAIFFAGDGWLTVYICPNLSICIHIPYPYCHWGFT